MRHGRGKFVVAAALAALAFALGYFSFKLGHPWGDDFAEYIAQAMAIWDGKIAEQLAINGYIISHSQMGLGPVAYPWGLPLLLAPLYGAFGVNLAVFKLVGIACFALTVFAAHLYFVKRLGGVWAAVLGLMFAVNPVLISQTNGISSDIPFMAVSTFALMAMEALLEGGAPRRQYAMGALSGLLALAAYLLRTNGVVLLLALFCAQALTLPAASPVTHWFYKGGARSDRPLLRAQALPCLIFIPAYLLLSRMLPGGGESHLQYMSVMNLRRFVTNIGYYLVLLKNFFPFGAFSAPVYAAAALLFLLGACRNARRFSFPLIYLAGTFALYVLWPYRQGIRFFLPVIPVFVLFMALGVKDLSALTLRARAGLGERVGQAAVLLLCAALCVLSLRGVKWNMAAGRATSEGAYGRAALKAYDYVRNNTPDDAVIAFRKPRALWLNTRRLSFTPGTKMPLLREAKYLLIVPDVSNAEKQVTGLHTPEELSKEYGIDLKLEHLDADFEFYRIETAPDA